MIRLCTPRRSSIGEKEFRFGFQFETVLFYMLASKPLVSIGMPTHDGARFIRESLDSLLSQDYQFFEVIISDNGSSDRTGEICHEYVRNDKRLRYFRNEQNLGAAKNFNRVLELSNGTYFLWASDHDLWHPSFISRCVSILEDDLTVVLAYSRTTLIDSDGIELGVMPDKVDTRSLSAVERYMYVVSKLEWCNMVYGVMRREVLSQTGGFRTVVSSDIVLMAELALLGTFAQIDEPLFFRRKNRPDEDSETYHKRILFDLDPTSAAEKSKAPAKHLYRELRNAQLRVLAHASIGLFDKLYAFIKTLKYYRIVLRQPSLAAPPNRDVR